MSTRLSTEELDALLADILAYNPLDGEVTDLLSRCYNALEDLGAARRALRDLTAIVPDLIRETALSMPPFADSPQGHDYIARIVHEADDALAAARAVLSENPKEPPDGT